MSLGDPVNGMLLIAKRISPDSEDDLQTIYQKRIKRQLDESPENSTLPGFFDDNPDSGGGVDGSFVPDPEPLGSDLTSGDTSFNGYGQGNDFIDHKKAVIFTLITPEGDRDPTFDVGLPPGIVLPGASFDKTSVGINPSRPEVIASLNFLPPNSQVGSFAAPISPITVRDLIDLRVGLNRILNKTCCDIYRELGLVVAGDQNQMYLHGDEQGIAVQSMQKIKNYKKLSSIYLSLAETINAYDNFVDMTSPDSPVVRQNEVNSRMSDPNYPGLGWSTPIAKTFEDQYHQFCNFPSDAVSTYFSNTKLWNQLISDVRSAIDIHSPTFLKWSRPWQLGTIKDPRESGPISGNPLGLSSRFAIRKYNPPHAFDSTKYGFKTSQDPILPYYYDGWQDFQDDMSTMGNSDWMPRRLSNAALMILTATRELNLSLYLLLSKKAVGSSPYDDLGATRVTANYNYDFLSNDSPSILWDRIIGKGTSNSPFDNGEYNITWAHADSSYSTIALQNGEMSANANQAGQVIYRPIPLSGFSLIRGTATETGKSSTLPLEERYVQLPGSPSQYSFGKEFFLDSFFVPDDDNKILDTHKIEDFSTIFQDNTGFFKSVVDDAFASKYYAYNYLGGGEGASRMHPERVWKDLLRYLSEPIKAAAHTHTLDATGQIGNTGNLYSSYQYTPSLQGFDNLQEHKDVVTTLALFQFAGWALDHPQASQTSFGTAGGLKQLLYHLVLAIKDKQRVQDDVVGGLSQGTPFPTPDGSSNVGQVWIYKPFEFGNVESMFIAANEQIFWGQNTTKLVIQGDMDDRIKKIIEKIASHFATQMFDIFMVAKDNGHQRRVFCHNNVHNASMNTSNPQEATHLTADYLSAFEGEDSGSPTSNMDFTQQHVFARPNCLKKVFFDGFDIWKLFNDLKEEITSVLNRDCDRALGEESGVSVLGAIKDFIIKFEKNAAEQATTIKHHTTEDGTSITWVHKMGEMTKVNVPDNPEAFPTMTPGIPRYVTNYSGMDGNTLAAFLFESAYTIFSIYPHCFFELNANLGITGESYVGISGSPEANRQLALMVRWCSKHSQDSDLSGDIFNNLKNENLNPWDWFIKNNESYGTAAASPALSEFIKSPWFSSLFNDNQYLDQPYDEDFVPWGSSQDQQYINLWNDVLKNSELFGWDNIARAGWSIRNEQAFLVWASEVFSRTSSNIKLIADATKQKIHNKFNDIKELEGKSLADLVGPNSPDLDGLSYPIQTSLKNSNLQQSYLRDFYLRELVNTVLYAQVDQTSGVYVADTTRDFGQKSVDDYGNYKFFHTPGTYIAEMVSNCLSGGKDSTLTSLKPEDAVNVKTLILGIPSGMLSLLQHQTYVDNGAEEYSLPGDNSPTNPDMTSPLDRSTSTIIEIEIHRKDHIYGQIIFEPIKMMFDMSLFVERHMFGTPADYKDLFLEAKYPSVPENIKDLIPLTRFLKYGFSFQNSSEMVEFTGNEWLYESIDPFSGKKSALKSYEIVGVTGADKILYQHTLSELLLLYYRIISGVEFDESTFVYNDHTWLHSVYIDSSCLGFLDAVSKGPGFIPVKNKVNLEINTDVAKIMPTGIMAMENLLIDPNTTSLPPELLDSNFDTPLMVVNKSPNVPVEQMKVLRSLLTSTIFSANKQGMLASVSKTFDRVFAVPVDIDRFYIRDESQPENSNWSVLKQQLLSEGKILPVSFVEAAAAGLPKEGTYKFNRSAGNDDDKNDSLFADTLMYKVRLLDTPL